jgi:DNA-binding NtrC family response regulator
MKILVVDDEKAVKPLFTQWFEEEIENREFEFVFAASAEEAIQCLSVTEYSDVVLILSDINMPGMNGIELLKLIKDKYPKLFVMIITAYGDEYNYNLAMKYGANEFIKKPLDLFALKEKMLAYQKAKDQKK